MPRQSHAGAHAGVQERRGRHLQPRRADERAGGGGGKEVERLPLPTPWKSTAKAAVMTFVRED